MRRQIWCGSALAAVLAVSACGTSKEATARPAASTVAPSFTAEGDIAVAVDYLKVMGAPTNAAGETPCTSADGYDDVAAGTQVVVRDEAGKTLAVGQLDDGKAGPAVESGPVKCLFPFSISGIPAGPKFYSIEVGHRQPVQFTVDAIHRKVLLTLG